MICRIASWINIKDMILGRDKLIEKEVELSLFSTYYLVLHKILSLFGEVSTNTVVNIFKSLFGKIASKT